MRLVGIVSQLCKLLSSSCGNYKNIKAEDELIITKILNILSLAVKDMEISNEIGIRGLHKIVIKLSTASLSDELFNSVEEAMTNFVFYIPKGQTFPMNTIDISYFSNPPTLFLFELNNANFIKNKIDNETEKEKVVIRLR